MMMKKKWFQQYDCVAMVTGVNESWKPNLHKNLNWMSSGLSNEKFGLSLVASTTQFVHEGHS